MKFQTLFLIAVFLAFLNPQYSNAGIREFCLRAYSRIADYIRAQRQPFYDLTRVKINGSEKQNPSVLPPGLQAYRDAKYLGQGGSSEVFLVTSPFSKKPVILKFIKREKLKTAPDFEKEFALAKAYFSDSKNVRLVQYKEGNDLRFALETPAFLELTQEDAKPAKTLSDKAADLNDPKGKYFDSDDPYIVLSKRYDVRNEDPKVKRYTEDLLEQLLKAGENLQKKNIVHADVKPGNMLVRLTKDNTFEVMDIDWGFASLKEKKDAGWVPAFPGGYGTLEFMDWESLSGHSVTPRRDTYARSKSIFDLIGHRLTKPQQIALQLGFSRDIHQLREVLQDCKKLEESAAYDHVAKLWKQQIDEFDRQSKKSLRGPEGDPYYLEYIDNLVVKVLKMGTNAEPFIKSLQKISPILVYKIYAKARDISENISEYENKMRAYDTWRDEVIEKAEKRHDLSVSEFPPPRSPISIAPGEWAVECNKWTKELTEWRAKNPTYRKVGTIDPATTFESLDLSPFQVFYTDFPPSEANIAFLNAFIKAKPK